eukprot:2092141-Rhodomonas_salina.2
MQAAASSLSWLNAKFRLARPGLAERGTRPMTSWQTHVCFGQQPTAKRTPKGLRYLERFVPKLVAAQIQRHNFRSLSCQCCRQVHKKVLVPSQV